MDYSDLIEEMQEFDETDLWWAPEGKDYNWEFYAVEEDDGTSGLMEYIGHGDDPIEAYEDAMEMG